jgi:hypothetical protein
MSFAGIVESISAVTIPRGKWRDSIEVSIIRERANALRVIESRMRSPIEEEAAAEEVEEARVEFASVKSFERSDRSVAASQSYGALIAMRSSWQIKCDAAIDALLEGVPMSQAGDVYSGMLHGGKQGGALESVFRPAEVTAIEEAQSTPAGVNEKIATRNIIKDLFSKLAPFIQIKPTSANVVPIDNEATARTANVFKWAGATLRRNNKATHRAAAIAAWYNKDDRDVLIRTAEERFEFA